MRPVTATSIVDAPRETVFDYLADIANHVEFTDHFLKDFRLERLDSRGVGAAARFRVWCPLSSPLGLDVWAEIVFTEVERPYRIVIDGGAGRLGRIKVGAVYKLTNHDQGMTRVELTLWTEPATKSDRFRELLGGRYWVKHGSRRALRRLKSILEEGEPSVHAVQVAPG
jgi:uncharacterized protein YndB with AHSA1/START domain